MPSHSGSELLVFQHRHTAHHHQGRAAALPYPASLRQLQTTRGRTSEPPRQLRRAQTAQARNKHRGESPARAYNLTNKPWTALTLRLPPLTRKRLGLLTTSLFIRRTSLQSASTPTVRTSQRTLFNPQKSRVHPTLGSHLSQSLPPSRPTRHGLQV